MAHVAFVLDRDYEDSEFEEPYKALRELGYACTVVGAEKGAELEGKGGTSKATTEQSAAGTPSEAFDALVIPGGFSPDRLRLVEDVVRLTRDILDAKKPVAAICHGPQLLIEAEAVKGRRVTSWPSVRKDLENAGAQWVNEEVVVDDNLITSRSPSDLPAFIDALRSALPAPGGGA